MALDAWGPSLGSDDKLFGTGIQRRVQVVQEFGVFLQRTRKDFRLLLRGCPILFFHCLGQTWQFQVSVGKSRAVEDVFEPGLPGMPSGLSQLRSTCIAPWFNVAASLGSMGPDAKRGLRIRQGLPGGFEIVDGFSNSLR